MHGLTGGWNAPQEWLMALSLSIKNNGCEQAAVASPKSRFQNAARIQSVDAAHKTPNGPALASLVPSLARRKVIFKDNAARFP